MIKGVVIKPLKKFSDNRGWLIETFRDDELPKKFKPVMGYISATYTHESRGPHEHKDQTDYFCFVGPGNFKMKLWDNRKYSSTYKSTIEMVVGEDNPCSILIPPGVVHGYKNISNVTAYYVNYPDKLYAGKNKKSKVDEIRHEDNKSEFVL